MHDAIDQRAVGVSRCLTSSMASVVASNAIKANGGLLRDRRFFIGYQFKTGQDARFRPGHMVLVEGQDVALRSVRASREKTDIPLTQCGNRATSPDTNAAQRHNVGPAADFHGPIADHHVSSVCAHEAR